MLEILLIKKKGRTGPKKQLKKLRLMRGIKNSLLMRLMKQIKNLLWSLIMRNKIGRI